MKVKVLKSFTDKNTNTLHKIDTEIELTAARCAEINGTPYGLFVEEIKPKKRVK